MLAAHFSFLYTTAHAWLVLVALMLLGAAVRLFFNLRHAGRTHWWIPGAAAIAAVALAFAIEPDDEPGAQTNGDVAAGRSVFLTSGCGDCHVLADAGTSGRVGPNLDAATPSLALVAERVRNGKGAMPSFGAQLSDRDIDAVAAYVAEVAGK
jgi:mono/diheme cytochrome c family protein